jgi:predicted nucleic acid-binding protein
LTRRLVIDGSVSGGWCFPDEASPLTEAVFEEVARSGAIVPALWLYEMANILTVAEQRGRIEARNAAVIRDALSDLHIELDHTRTLRSLPALAELARDHRLTGYDAAYLELALRTGSTLATLDGALERAAPQAGVLLFSL